MFARKVHFRSKDFFDRLSKCLLQTTEPDGKKILRVMYKHPGNDVSGILSRSEKIVNTCEKVRVLSTCT